ncbi:hypothetical protein A2U01_0038114 [Trifolium medium]|uniref:Uncharacterized protein n=1 Tax=Trifolium medium TaxID=97028 RepID=A0A392PYQ0_9FABA|nr:hypothetical protein [Trifolium medium]
MKRGNSKASAQEKKKEPEKKASASKPSKAQKKLKFKQEESSESAKIDSDFGEFLKTYDHTEEDTGSEEEVTQKFPRTKKSKKKVSKLLESVQDSN